MLIKGYAKNSDITLMNTLYLYPRKDETGKYDKGTLIVIYKDNVTGEKHKEEIEDPDYLCYRCIDPTIDYHPLVTSKEFTEEYLFKYKDLDKEVAKLTNQMDAYRNNIENGNRKANKLLHVSPGANMLMSDMHIEENFRYRFSKEYKNDIIPISKSFLDIEVDAITADPSEPVGSFKGKYPINAVTIILEEQNLVYTFLLRNKNNPLVEQFEKSINANLFSELKEFIIDSVGGSKQAHKYGVDSLKFNMCFYDEDDEIRLIQDLFIVINKYKPDFTLAWNMAFDIPYIIDRIRILGYDPSEIICHPDFEHKVAEYYVDDFHLNDIEARGDYGKISSYTIFIDQLIQFGSRRKGQSKMRLSLDNVGETQVGIHKLDYSHITNSVVQLPYLDYKTFVFYNIMDTIVQKCIEHKAGDIDYIFGKSIMNNTRYSKVHRQTTYLTNRMTDGFEKRNYIIGNNVNRLLPNDTTETFDGAFVSDPTLLSDYSKMYVNGIPMMIFNILFDYDFKSLYPNDLLQFGIAHNTMIGKIIIEAAMWDKENQYKNPNFDRGGTFLDDYQSKNLIHFYHRWLGLGTYEELYNDILYYLNNIEFTAPKLYNLQNGLYNPFFIMPEGSLANPFRIRREDELLNPFIIYKSPETVMNKIKGELKIW